MALTLDEAGKLYLVVETVISGSSVGPIYEHAFFVEVNTLIRQTLFAG